MTSDYVLTIYMYMYVYMYIFTNGNSFCIHREGLVAFTVRLRYHDSSLIAGLRK